MGTRIYSYAVDVAEMKSLAAMSLHQLLWFYAEQPRIGDDLLALQFWDHEHLRMYYARPGNEVYCSVRSEPKSVKVSKAETSDLPYLATSVADFYSQHSSISLSLMLECLGDCPNITWIQPVTTRHRRWWIGSFLDYAASVFRENSQDYIFLRTLFQKMLRGAASGAELPDLPFELSDFSFPIMPAEDTDMYMSIWSNEEVHRLLHLLDVLTTPTMPTFKSPDDPAGNDPDEDKAWNEWVQEKVGEFLQVKTLSFADLNLINFIG